MKCAKYHDLEDSVYRTELTYDEVTDTLDKNYFPSKSASYTLPPGKYEIGDINKTLTYSLPDIMKVSITIEDIRIRCILSKNQTLISSKRSFFHTFSGFIQHHSGNSGDINGYIHLIPGTYKNERPIKISRIDKDRLRCDCINGSIVNGVPAPILYGFTIDKPPGHKINHTAKIKLFKRINKSVLSHHVLSGRR